jgi:kynureninase
MKTTLVLCFATLISTVGCVRTIDLPVEEPNFTIKEFRNCILNIDHCSRFIEDNPGMYMALTNACDAAGFVNYRLHTESIDQDVWVMYIYAESGYAALWVHQKDQSCVLEFCSTNTEYSYNEFLDMFMTEFYSIEHTKEWETTFTELLEWDESARFN